VTTPQVGELVCDCRYVHQRIVSVDPDCPDDVTLEDGFVCSYEACCDSVPHDWEHPAPSSDIKKEHKMTDPFDVYWHMEHTEGSDWIVVRVPQAANQATQGHTFDEVKQAVRELVAVWSGDLSPDDVTVGAFYEESEPDFLEAIA
jgi:predicted RNase H-like HicB family nuclease